jgi:hypothetical protein
MFKIGMKLGLIPEHVCVECANVWNRSNVRASDPLSEQVAAD